MELESNLADLGSDPNVARNKHKLPRLRCMRVVMAIVNKIKHVVKACHREWRMQKLNKAYAKLRADKKEWDNELKERSIFERASGDGLKDI